MESSRFGELEGEEVVVKPPGFRFQAGGEEGEQWWRVWEV